MLPQLQKETVLLRVKNILKENNIKLWLPPYFNKTENSIENLRVTSCLMELASRYSTVLNIVPEQCSEILLELQKKSLNGLVEREQFKAEGIATIRVKISGQQIPEFSVKLKLLDTVEILKQNISQKIDIALSRLKLISNGKILKNECTLQEFNIKHGSAVLVLILQHNEGENVMMETETNRRLIEETKNDVKLLNKRKLKFGRYLSITNQNGVSLDLPPLESKKLLTAMALHEKGRTAFKREQYSLALVFFLEADEEFKNCHADVLNKVDNYGLLNLDIVWTYLHLQSLHYLSDAEARLKTSQETFMISYGPDFERLSSIKGSVNERILFVRLHLLQGIICHALNKREEALNLLESVENEIKSLKVNHDKLTSLCKLGYSTEEAVLALRATYNNLNAAADYILKRREEKDLIKKYEKIRIFADCHTCQNGSQINLTVLQQLRDMGYSQLLAVQALMYSNNEINGALIWIENFICNLNNIYPLYIVDVILSIEFDLAGVLPILIKNKYKLNDLCIRELLLTTTAGQEYIKNLNLENDLTMFGVTSPSDSNSSTNCDGLSSDITTAVASTSVENTSTVAVTEAYNRLSDGVSNFEDDHLNINLESEEKFLKFYKSLL